MAQYFCKSSSPQTIQKKHKLWRSWRRFCFLFLASLLLWVLPLSWVRVSSVAQSVPVNALEQQGMQLYQSGQFSSAIAIFEQGVQSGSPSPTLYNYLAESYRQVGQLDAAIKHWDNAKQLYQDQDESRAVAAVLTQQAQAYSHLGQNSQALKRLETALEIIQNHPDPKTEAGIRGALGNVYRNLGDYEAALAAHQISLQLAQDLEKTDYLITAWNNLGNVYLNRAERHQYQAQVAQSEKDLQEEARLTNLATNDLNNASNAYQQALEISRKQGGIAEVRALINLNHLLEKIPTTSQNTIVNNRERALTLLATLPDSRDKAYALINLAAPDTTDTLLAALTVARNIGDSRAESFAFGTLGGVYEAAQQYDHALQLTRQAQSAAQQAMAADSLYRWQWQAGRILNAQGDNEKAISAYEQAITTLQTIRGDLVAANQELQFSFRDSVEPVYRELIELLLEKATLVSQVTKAQSPILPSHTLQKALDTLELLKLAELQNFFGDDCVQVAQSAAQENADLADADAAIIYSVVLRDRATIILHLPDGSLNFYPIKISATALQTEIDQLRLVLEDQSTETYIEQSQKIYDLLLRPLEKDLTAANPQTLVFVQDGVLRKVPMAALFDGKQFLIEKYPIANVPSLSLTSYSPRVSNNFKALALGLTLERPSFASLVNIKDEVGQVKGILGGTQLIDEQFTLDQLRSQLEKDTYPIIHMATHGKFGVDANSTFLLAYDQRIQIDELDQVLRERKGQEPIELLTMSACQTAAGDNRSALGIAGVAVRAGVKSAVASLWYISDEATVPLIEEFYTQLKQPGITKAEALRQAQIKLINDPYYNHPALWSPLILIGNWS
jgi:CHAT domain-containing protein